MLSNIGHAQAATYIWGFQAVHMRAERRARLARVPDARFHCPNHLPGLGPCGPSPQPLADIAPHSPPELLPALVHVYPLIS